MISYPFIGVAHAASMLLAETGPLALAIDFIGPVVSVLDGDTIEVLHNRH
jgi:hypothetical protein